MGITSEAGERSNPAPSVSLGVVVVMWDGSGNRVVEAEVEEFNDATALTGWLLENDTVATEERDAGGGGILPKLKTCPPLAPWL